MPVGLFASFQKANNSRPHLNFTPFHNAKGAESAGTSSGGAMSRLPSVGFWNPREENRFRIGRRIRDRNEVGNTDVAEAEARANDNVPTNDSSHQAGDRQKRLGPALQKARGRVSRLWKRETPSKSFATNTTASSPIASDDECCQSTQSKNSRIDDAPAVREQLSSQNSHEETSSGNSDSKGSRLWNSLPKLRKRRVSKPIPAVGAAGEEIEIQLSHSEDTLDSLNDPARGGPSASKACSIVVPPSQSSESRGAEAASVIDAATSTACAGPSLDGKPTAEAGGEVEALGAPKPRKRKSRKPKHGDDSVLIGMEIMFDPTTELLDLGREPQCIKRTTLVKLQQNDEHTGFLLGSMKNGEEESTEESTSFSDLLGFQLDAFALPKKMDTSMEEEPECAFPEVTTAQEEDISDLLGFHLDVFALPEKLDTSMEEEPVCPFPDATMDADEAIEITFHGSPRKLFPNVTGIDDSLEQVNPDDEIEIVFYPIENFHTPVEEEPSDDDSKSSSKYPECTSKASAESSILPFEWMLPELNLQTSTGSTFWRLPNPEPEPEAPEYEWFHPDHLDLEIVKKHSPRLVFGSVAKPSTKSSFTPITIAETVSFADAFSSFDDGSDGPEEEVMSTGSLPSDAVRNLIQFCRSASHDIQDFVTADSWR